MLSWRVNSVRALGQVLSWCWHARRGETASWDVYMSSMAAIGGVVPWMLVEGNHERDEPFTGDRYQNQNADSGGAAQPLLCWHNYPS
jgi:hypothetical protein